MVLACNGHTWSRGVSADWDIVVRRINSGDPFTPDQILALAGKVTADEMLDWLNELWCAMGIDRSA